MKKIIIKAAKVIGSLTTIGTVMWFAFTGYHNINDGISDIKSDIVIVKDSVAIVDAKVDAAIAIGVANSGKIDDNIQSTKAVTRSYVNYIKKDESLTREEFFDVMDPWLNDVDQLKKKMSLNPQGSIPWADSFSSPLEWLPKLNTDLLITSLK